MASLRFLLASDRLSIRELHRPRARRKRGRKPGSKNVSKELKVTAVEGGSFTVKLKELAALAGQIDKAESDLGKLRAKFESLKAAL